MTATVADPAPPSATADPPAARRPQRWAESGLLVLALTIGVSAFAIVSLKLTGALPNDFWLLVGLAVAVVLAIHIVLRVRAPYADQVMLPIVVALNGLGLAMIYRLDLGSQITGGTQNLVPRQFQWTILGVVCATLLVVFLRDHRILRRYSYTAMAVGIALVAMPLIPGIGTQIHGAKIWVNIAGFSLQPAEFAKIAFAIFFAGYLVTNRDTLTLAGPKFLGLQLPRLRDLGPILIVWLVSLAVLIFERDLGTSLLFFGLFVAMLYIATERFSWVVIGLILVAVGGAVAASSLGHVQARFDVWLHPFDPDVYNRSFGGSGQLVGGLFGLANGGLFGTGLGAGYPRTVPFAYSDFIYTSLGEELGLVGLMAILVAYLVFIERGLRTALGVRDGFGKLLAGGLAFVTAWQLFIVIGGITRIIPLTGLTMPFVAQGGSSLLANWLILGLLLRISDNARRPSAEPTRGEIVTGGVRHRDDDLVPIGPDVQGIAVDSGGGGPRPGAAPDDAPTVAGVLPDATPTMAGITPADAAPTVAGVLPPSAAVTRTVDPRDAAETVAGIAPADATPTVASPHTGHPIAPSQPWWDGGAAVAGRPDSHQGWSGGAATGEPEGGMRRGGMRSASTTERALASDGEREHPARRIPPGDEERERSAPTPPVPNPARRIPPGDEEREHPAPNPEHPEHPDPRSTP